MLTDVARYNLILCNGIYSVLVCCSCDGRSTTDDDHWAVGVTLRWTAPPAVTGDSCSANTELWLAGNDQVTEIPGAHWSILASYRLFYAAGLLHWTAALHNTGLWLVVNYLLNPLIGLKWGGNICNIGDSLQWHGALQCLRLHPSFKKPLWVKHWIIYLWKIFISLYNSSKKVMEKVSLSTFMGQMTEFLSQEEFVTIKSSPLDQQMLSLPHTFKLLKLL